MTDVLSGLDSLFIHLEDPRTPMHAASIGIFEGAPLTSTTGQLPIDEIRRHVCGHLDQMPKLRQRVRRVPLGLGPPAWEDDPEFDILNHVRRVAVPPPGGDVELLAVCAELMSWQLDMAHPLWELWFVEGLADGRVAVLEKFHHAMADGLSGAELALVLLDAKPEQSPPPGPSDWRAEAPKRLVDVETHDLSERAAEFARLAGAAAASVVHPRRALHAVADLADGVRALFGHSVFAPHVPINAPVGRHRRLAMVRHRLEELEATANKHGVTVNDLLLAAVAGGLRTLLAGRGESAHEAQVLVPVGLAHVDAGELGNRVSAMVVRLPLEAETPKVLLDQVAQASASAKAHHQSQAAHLLVDALDALPEPALELAGTIVQHQPFVNLVVTNVPGPPAPLYAMGARMLEAIPLVPIAGNLSIGVAALSYDGNFAVGITADRDQCPDVAVLAGGIEDTFAALCRFD